MTAATVGQLLTAAGLFGQCGQKTSVCYGGKDSHSQKPIPSRGRSRLPALQGTFDYHFGLDGLGLSKHPPQSTPSSPGPRHDYDIASEVVNESGSACVFLEGRRTRAGWKGNPNHTRPELVIDLTLRLSLINAYDAATDVAQ